jgi:hypothetical protein
MGQIVLGPLHTHRLFAGVGSGSGRGVSQTTGITAAGSQFDFERCTRKLFVHINRNCNLLVAYRLRYLKQSFDTDRFRHVCKFQCSYIKTDKPATGPAPSLLSSRPAR